MANLRETTIRIIIVLEYCGLDVLASLAGCNYSGVQYWEVTFVRRFGLLTVRSIAYVPVSGCVYQTDSTVVSFLHEGGYKPRIICIHVQLPHLCQSYSFPISLLLTSSKAYMEDRKSVV